VIFAFKYEDGYVRVVFGWYAIQSKDVHKIIKLPVYITTHCELSALSYTSPSDSLVI